MHDPQQAERLANTYADAILRLSYTYLKSTHDAQDVCQTVFLRLLSEPRSFESPQHERAYVLRMAANACKDLLKTPPGNPARAAGRALGGARRGRPGTALCFGPWRPCRPITGRSSISIITRAIRPRRSAASWASPPPLSTPGWPGDGQS